MSPSTIRVDHADLLASLVDDDLVLSPTLFFTQSFHAAPLARCPGMFMWRCECGSQSLGYSSSGWVSVLCDGLVKMFSTRSPTTSARKCSMDTPFTCMHPSRNAAGDGGATWSAVSSCWTISCFRVDMKALCHRRQLASGSPRAGRLVSGDVCHRPEVGLSPPWKA